ncbi:flagellar biosynthesis protein FlhF [Symbiobacterium thermophilum]|uniref:flagellar biosynthesis protein FlhF n=1 Tax=Symbiobacterium thermophilum TaxID=2734 RepID=UPI0002F4C697|nr:flagellar biosynthesis protein FlhF [Symbiobacterium thermophilum]
MMQVKKYMAPTYAEALILAKNELGTDAVIVDSRKVRVGGIFGLFGRVMTELTVAADQRPQPYRGARPAARPRGATAPSGAPASAQPAPTVPQGISADAAPAVVHGGPAPAAAAVPQGVSAAAPVAPQGVSAAAVPQPVAGAAASASPASGPAPAPEPAAAPAAAVWPALSDAVPASPLSGIPLPGSPASAALAPGSADLAGLRREMADLRQAVTRLVEARPDPAALLELKGYARKVYERLLDAGVAEGLALAISRKVGTHATKGRALLRAELNQLMGPGAPIQAEAGRRRVVALIGPTGVGKTTTLAKLAAHFALERGLKVGLITADTFRIAAVDQLRTYADILAIPLYTVERPTDVHQALAHNADADLVLMDTGGRSHKDEERMAELQELLAEAQPDEVHLVVSLNTNPRDVRRMLERYLPLGVNRFIFTKADETSAPGLMLNIRAQWDLPISYVTDGQSVPDDLRPADSVDYSKLFMGA